CRIFDVARTPRKAAPPKRSRKAPTLVAEPELLEAQKPATKKSRPLKVAQPREVEILPEDGDDSAPEEILLKPEAASALDSDRVENEDGDALLEAAEEAEAAAERQAALVPYDPLSRYLAEVRRFPLLTREEEIVIAKRYAEHQNPEDAYKLVT